MSQREDIFAGFAEQPRVPVVILGGGINGIGLLRELSLQGIRCLLVDRADFAAGASSKSSRMIHGGLRYLENREFALVRESLLERNRLLTNAAHYVSPLKTSIPMYSRLGGFLRSALIFFGVKVRPGARGSLITKLGLMFYDWVTRKNRRTPRHHMAGRAEALRTIPGINPEIVGVATYWDAKITQAERLCIELIKDARSADPKSAAMNYVVPQGIENGRLILKDLVGDKTFGVEPQVVVNATGAWVDSTNCVLGIESHFMGGTKGSHLVVDCPALFDALGDQMVYYQHADGRVCIAFRFMDKVIMGSTDIPVASPDDARCDEGEVQYMLSTLRGVFPGIEIKREHIVYAFCGVRPLPAANTAVTANISRGHTITTIEPAEGRPFATICLIGGKWTTFRALAEQTTDQLLTLLGASRTKSSEELAIGGGENFPADDAAKTKWINDLAATSGLSEKRIGDLLERYGTRARDFAMSNCQERPLRTLPDYTIQEIERIAREEQVVHLSDLVYRRSVIGLLGQATPEVLTELAEVVGGVLGWDDACRDREVERSLEEQDFKRAAVSV